MVLLGVICFPYKGAPRHLKSIETPKKKIYICTAHSPETHRAHQLDRKITHQNNKHYAFFARGCEAQNLLVEKNNLRHTANDIS